MTRGMRPIICALLALAVLVASGGLCDAKGKGKGKGPPAMPPGKQKKQPPAPPPAVYDMTWLGSFVPRVATDTGAMAGRIGPAGLQPPAIRETDGTVFAIAEEPGLVWAINQGGEVLWSEIFTGQMWLYTPGVGHLPIEPGPEGYQAFGRGLTDEGLVVGSVQLETGYCAAVWTHGDAAPICVAPGQFAVAHAGGLALGVSGGTYTEPDVWPPPPFTVLTYDQGILTEAPLGDQWQAWGVNATGLSLWSDLALRQDGVIVEVIPQRPDCTVFDAYGPSDASLVAGNASCDGQHTPWQWTPEHGLEMLDTLVQGPEGCRVFQVHAVTAGGRIAGSGTCEGQTQGVLLTPTAPTGPAIAQR